MAGSGETPLTKPIFVLSETNEVWDDLPTMLTDLRTRRFPEDSLTDLRDAFGGDDEYDSVDVVDGDGNEISFTKEEMVVATQRGGWEGEPDTGSTYNVLTVYEYRAFIPQPGEPVRPPPPATTWELDDDRDMYDTHDMYTKFYESIDDLLAMEEVRSPSRRRLQPFKRELFEQPTLDEFIPVASSKHHYAAVLPHIYHPKRTGKGRRRTGRARRARGRRKTTRRR